MDLSTRWGKSQLTLNEFLQLEGFTYSKCAKSVYRRVGNELLAMAGKSTKEKQAIVNRFTLGD